MSRREIFFALVCNSLVSLSRAWTESAVHRASVDATVSHNHSPVVELAGSQVMSRDRLGLEAMPVGLSHIPHEP